MGGLVEGRNSQFAQWDSRFQRQSRRSAPPPPSSSPGDGRWRSKPASQPGLSDPIPASPGLSDPNPDPPAIPVTAGTFPSSTAFNVTETPASSTLNSVDPPGVMGINSADFVDHRGNHNGGSSSVTRPAFMSSGNSGLFATSPITAPFSVEGPVSSKGPAAPGGPSQFRPISNPHFPVDPNRAESTQLGLNNSLPTEELPTASHIFSAGATHDLRGTRKLSWKRRAGLGGVVRRTIHLTLVFLVSVVPNPC
ncbi:hypothetical protein SLA2020_404120 [Shorea laevis]